jgi:prepilin-type N-terminal cleavage/methylation domain-containing protein
MSPSSSERDGFSGTPRKERGLTLIELLVGVAISGLLIVGLVRFFKDSHRSVDMQDQLAERDQNLAYVLKKLSDRLMEAGSGLPDSAWPVISSISTGDTLFKIGINPKGGLEQTDTVYNSTQKLPVDDHLGFKGSPQILVVYQNPDKPPELLTIKADHNTQGFVGGFKDMTNRRDTIYLTEVKSFGSGDMLYSYTTESYRLADTSLYLGNMVLAEGIDSVRLNFLNAAGTAATAWHAMRSARLRVLARTDRKQPGLPGDGYRRASQSLAFRLRNKN